MRVAAGSPLPTVREVIELPELQAGRPRLIAGDEGQDRDVRWAHVFAGTAVAGLLDGGELILATGAGWPRDESGIARLADELTRIGASVERGSGRGGVAAIVLELGPHFDAAPAPLVRACGERGVPLIVLHREVRFVQITQRVHQRILAAQNEALEARAAVHDMLTELGLNRSPVDYVVEQLAETIGAPVVLEGASHGVVTLAGHSGDASSVLDPWRFAAGGEPVLPPGSERVPVEARGTRWGVLTALPGPPHPAGRRTVLELGAFALALGRLADAEGEQWLEFGSKRVFDVLLGGRYRGAAELEAQLAAAGLPIERRVTVAATLQSTGDFGSHASLERAALETALRRAAAPEGRVLVAPDAGTGAGAPILLALLSFPEGDERATMDRILPPLATRLARELDMLVPGTTPTVWRAHLALGAPSRRLRTLVASLEQLRSAGRLPASAETGRVAVQLVERQALAHLVRGLAALPELQEFSADTLGPLIEHDRTVGPGHSGDLLRVLAAYTAHPTNRSLAASEARLSRSVFYQRLALIEELLAVDLADGETIAALAVALLARPV